MCPDAFFGMIARQLSQEIWPSLRFHPRKLPAVLIYSSAQTDELCFFWGIANVGRNQRKAQPSGQTDAEKQDAAVPSADPPLSARILLTIHPYQNQIELEGSLDLRSGQNVSAS